MLMIRAIVRPEKVDAVLERQDECFGSRQATRNQDR